MIYLNAFLKQSSKFDVTEKLSLGRINVRVGRKRGYAGYTYSLQNETRSQVVLFIRADKKFDSILLKHSYMDVFHKIRAITVESKYGKRIIII
jgi:hypothetical protein